MITLNKSSETAISINLIDYFFQIKLDKPRNNVYSNTKRRKQMLEIKRTLEKPVTVMQKVEETVYVVGDAEYTNKQIALEAEKKLNAQNVIENWDKFVNYTGDDCFKVKNEKDYKFLYETMLYLNDCENTYKHIDDNIFPIIVIFYVPPCGADDPYTLEKHIISHKDIQDNLKV